MMECYEAIKDAGISYLIIFGDINTYPNEHHCHQSSLKSLSTSYVLYMDSFHVRHKEGCFFVS